MKKILSLITGLLILLPLTAVWADDFVPADEEKNSANTLTLDADNTGGDVTLQFGGTLAEYLRWNNANLRFDLSDDIRTTGNIETDGNTLTLDTDNSGGNITLQFGATLAETLQWDSANSLFALTDDLSITGQAYVAASPSATDSNGVLNLGRNSSAWENLTWNDTNDQFEISDDLSLGQKQIKSVALDNLTSAPGSPVPGQIYHNTTNSNTYVWSGSLWEDITAAAGVVGSPEFENIYSNDADKILTTGNGPFTIAVGTNTFAVTGGVDFSGASRLAMHQGAANPGTCTEGDLFYNTSTNFTYICTAANAWNAVQPDTATFTDTTPGAIADNNTGEIFNDATRPNITTDSSSSTVLVSFMVRGTAVDNDTESNAFRIIRETDGTNPVCGTDPQVGEVIIGNSTDAGALWSASGTFLDSPGVTGEIRYTICNSTVTFSSNDTDATSNAANVTLVELGN